MTFDSATVVSGPRDAHAPGFEAHVAHGSTRPGPPSRLLLFVGMLPGAELSTLLAIDGMRCLSLPDVATALDAARLARFDAVVLQAAALGAAPARALEALRRTLCCPLVVAAGSEDEVDEILALEQGADAWLPRPMAARRLRAHLLALLRLRATAPEVHVDRTPPCRWRIDRVLNRLHGAAPGPVALTEVQAALLQRLVDADGRVVSRAQLADSLVPSHGHALQARSVDVYVHRLRDRLRKADATDHDIEAVRGRGYRLCALTVPGNGPD